MRPTRAELSKTFLLELHQALHNKETREGIKMRIDKPSDPRFHPSSFAKFNVEHLREAAKRTLIACVHEAVVKATAKYANIETISGRDAVYITATLNNIAETKLPTLVDKGKQDDEALDHIAKEALQKANQEKVPNPILNYAKAYIDQNKKELGYLAWMTGIAAGVTTLFYIASKAGGDGVASPPMGPGMGPS